MNISIPTSMPTYDVFHLPCGHVTQVIDRVPASERHLYPQRGTTDTLCKPCWSQQMERVKFRDDVPLPNLIGTERQIAWAESVRREHLTTLTNRITSARTSGDDPEAERLVSVYGAVRAIKRANTWIRNATKLPEQMTVKAIRKTRKTPC